MLDLLLANYSDISYIMKQESNIGIQMIIKAKERQDDARQWQLYCSLYPHFTKDTFLTFDDFTHKKKSRVVLKPKEYIFDDVKKMREKHGWK